MTIFVLHNNFVDSSFNKEAGEDVVPEYGQLLYALPDTALLKNSKPFFIPVYADPCKMEMQMGIRISRLGRTISERFAYRYWDAATVVAHFIAQPLFEEARAKGYPWSAAMGFDGAVPLGQFIPKEELPKEGIPYSLSLDGQPLMKAEMTDLEAKASAAIAFVSRFFMLRNGDLILLGSPLESVTVNVEHHVDATLCERDILSFNIK